ncbi:MAG: VOC family protein [Pseudomonadales bacterium]|nr:VOC family protein [Pseudomonadales bacterium]
MRNTGFHHVAFACRDLHETVHFYQDLLGFPLIHTEMQGSSEGYMKHIFFDLGDGSSMAFFYLKGVGEPQELKTDISTGLGLPVWVNHVAFAADQARYDQVKATMSEAGMVPVMEVDHDWCHSVYYGDPNGILVEFCMDTPGIQPDNQKATELLDANPA